MSNIQQEKTAQALRTFKRLTKELGQNHALREKIKEKAEEKLTHKGLELAKEQASEAAAELSQGKAYQLGSKGLAEGYEKVMEGIESLETSLNIGKSGSAALRSVLKKFTPNAWSNILSKLAKIGSNPAVRRAFPIILRSGGLLLKFLSGVGELELAGEVGVAVGHFMYNFLKKHNPKLLKQIEDSIPAKVVQYNVGLAYNQLGKVVDLKGSNTDLQKQKQKNQMVTSNRGIEVVNLMSHIVGRGQFSNSDTEKYTKQYINLLKQNANNRQIALQQLAFMILKDKKKQVPPNLRVLIQKTIQNTDKTNQRQQAQKAQPQVAQQNQPQQGQKKAVSSLNAVRLARYRLALLREKI